MTKTDNVHERFDREEAAHGPSNRTFGISLGLILVAGGLGLYWGGRTGGWLLGAGAGLCALGLTFPSLLAPLNRGWMWLGLLLFRIVNPVVMALLFVLAILPVSLIMRVAGKDSLRLRRDAGTTSYWVPRDPPGPAPETMKNQF